jgi:uracil-DNA glycosylase family 4
VTPSRTIAIAPDPGVLTGALTTRPPHPPGPAVSLLEPPPFASWADLERAALGCTKCPLSVTRTHVVFGVGDPHANLLFVGEGPGEQEDLSGEPFVGRAGRLLTGLIEDIGLTRSQVYIANVVKCRPPGNRDPQPLEIDSCRPYLEAQVAFIEPRVVVTLGNFATKLLLDTKEGITKLRGREFPFRDGAVLIPVFHPSAVLRNGGAALAEARADFVTVKRALVRASASS